MCGNGRAPALSPLYPVRADIDRFGWHVSNGPQADIGWVATDPTGYSVPMENFDKCDQALARLKLGPLNAESAAPESDTQPKIAPWALIMARPARWKSGK